jgi:GNAT superfamily N-acetyltransferase
VEDHSELDIRPAVPADAARYATVAAETFFEAYADSSDPANLAAHIEREFGEAKQRRELDAPAITVLAAHEPSGDWAGFATLRADVSTDGVVATRPIEIVRFYVRGRWHGRGAARRLMEAAFGFAAARGHDAVWLQVWEENARARRFYEKCGLRAVGTRPFLFGEVWEDDIVYAKRVLPVAAG